MELNDLTYKIRGAALNVHKELGPGLLESVYEAALWYELNEMGLNVNRQIGIPAQYRGIELGLGFRMDMLVEEKIIIEVKSVEFLHHVYKKQLLTYLKLSN